jgi:hypothetical protein
MVRCSSTKVYVGVVLAAAMKCQSPKTFGAVPIEERRLKINSQAAHGIEEVESPPPAS